MRLRFIFTFAFFLTGSLGWAMPCETLLNPEANAKAEIVELILERENLAGESKPALKTLLEKNIHLKKLEYLQTFGKPLDQVELSALVANQEAEINAAKQINTIHTKELKQVEENSLVLTREVITLPKGNRFEGFDSQELGSSFNGLANGGGHQWTSDERFVLIRSNVYSNKANQRVSQGTLIDLQSKKILSLPFSADAGYLSNNGHYYASNPEPNVTFVHSLDTGEVWGPFEGNPKHKYFNSKYIVTEMRTKREYQDEIHYFYNNFRANKKVEIGAPSWKGPTQRNGHDVIVAETGSAIVTFDTQSETVIHKIRGSDAHFENGFVWFRRTFFLGFKYIMRYSDGKVFRSPRNDYPKELALNQSKVVMRTKNKQTLVDLKTRKTVLTASSIGISPDGNYAYIPDYRGPKGKVNSLITGKQKEVTVVYEGFTADGQWLWRNIEEGTKELFNIHTQQTIRLSADNRMFRSQDSYALAFSKNKDAIIFLRNEAPPAEEIGDIDGGYVSNIYMGTLEDHPKGEKASALVKIGEKGFGQSPSGRYFVTYRNGHIFVGEIE